VAGLLTFTFSFDKRHHVRRSLGRQRRDRCRWRIFGLIRFPP